MKALAVLILPLLAAPLLAPLGWTHHADTAMGKGAKGSALSSTAATGGLQFSAPRIIDCYRAGGEPTIAATASGALVVAAHPGYTHMHNVPPGAPRSTDLCDLEPGPAKVAASSQAQTYMWRSADGGQTWHPVTLPETAAEMADVDLPNLPNEGPRSVAYGISDPDLAIDGNGRIWYVEIPAPAGAGPSVSWSDDDGLTFEGRPQAALGFDRPWLAAHGSTVYLTGSTTAIYASQDGLTFTQVGAKPGGCNGDPVASPLDGTMYIACGQRVAVSADGGATWTLRATPLNAHGAAPPEVAIDASGKLWTSGASATSPLAFASSPDHGVSWITQDLDAAALFPRLAGGHLVLFQAKAGSTGRAAAVFLGSPPAATTTALEWRVYAVLLIDGQVLGAELTPDPVHRGGICTDLNCLVNQFSANGQNLDRRIGDLFEPTIDRQGALHVVYGDTEAYPSDWVSHVGYVRLLGGASLLDGPLPEGFPTQG